MSGNVTRLGVAPTTTAAGILHALPLGAFSRLDVRTDLMAWLIADVVARVAGSAFPIAKHNTNPSAR